MTTTLLLPGLDGSGPGHWQHWWWLDDPSAVLVEQADWRRPSLQAWSARLIDAIRAHPHSWLVAHSLGVALVTWVAAQRFDLPIAGALLVAPAEVDDGMRATERVADFAPMSRAPLPFPAAVVASRNDRCMQVRRSMMFAETWGAHFIDYGEAGHINVAAGFGAWPDGRRLLTALQARHNHATRSASGRLRPSLAHGRSAAGPWVASVRGCRPDAEA